MNELLIKSFLINTYSLMNLLPEAIKKITHSADQHTDKFLFKNALKDIEDFYPLFTLKAFQESLTNAKKLNENECQIYLAALEDKFQNIYKANAVVALHEPSFLEQIEIKNKDTEVQFFNTF